MLTGTLGKIYMYTPLRHSFTVAIGATVLSLLIGGSLAWLVVRTDMPGRKLVNQLALIPYIMPSWTLAQAWLVFFKSTSFSGGTPGVYEYFFGQAPPPGCHTGRCRSWSVVRCITTLSFSCLCQRR